MKFKEWFTEKRVLWIMAFLLIGSTLLDMYTAFSSPIFELAEINSLYVMYGSKLLLVFVSLITVSFFIYKLAKGMSLHSIYFFSIMIIYLSIGHFYGAYTNISAEEQFNSNPDAYTAAIESMSQQDKVNLYTATVWAVIILPVLLGFSAFIVTMFFYNQRAPRRDKIIDDIIDNVKELKRF